jgi:hypothetical protein
MASSGMLRRVALVRNVVLEERITSIIRVTKIGELGMLQEPHDVTSQKATFFTVRAVKASYRRTTVLLLVTNSMGFKNVCTAALS